MEAKLKPVDINERIAQVMYHYRLNKSKFGQRIGVAPAVIHNIVVAKRNGPSASTSARILAEFPELSPQWYYSGKGPMFIGDNNNQGKQGENTINSSVSQQPEELTDTAKDNVFESESLKKELKYLQEIIITQGELIKSKDAEIATLKELIDLLKRQTPPLG